MCPGLALRAKTAPNLIPRAVWGFSPCTVVPGRPCPGQGAGLGAEPSGSIPGTRFLGNIPLLPRRICSCSGLLAFWCLLKIQRRSGSWEVTARNWLMSPRRVNQNGFLWAASTSICSPDFSWQCCGNVTLGKKAQLVIRNISPSAFKERGKKKTLPKLSVNDPGMIIAELTGPTLSHASPAWGFRFSSWRPAHSLGVGRSLEMWS